MNRFQLAASIVERDALRYTPAGIPIVTAKLLHQSKQTEAGIERQVEFEMTAVASGEIAGKFNLAEMGVTQLLTGFMARKSRKSKSLVFHVIDIQTLQPVQASAII